MRGDSARTVGGVTDRTETDLEHDDGLVDEQLTDEQLIDEQLIDEQLVDDRVFAPTAGLVSRAELLHAMIELLALWRTRAHVLQTPLEKLSAAVQLAANRTRAELETPDPGPTETTHIDAVGVLVEQVRSLAAHRNTPEPQRAFTRRLVMLNRDLAATVGTSSLD